MINKWKKCRLEYPRAAQVAVPSLQSETGAWVPPGRRLVSEEACWDGGNDVSSA